jgi:hypothetical protein
LRVSQRIAQRVVGRFERVPPTGQPIGGERRLILGCNGDRLHGTRRMIERGMADAAIA